VAFFIRGNVIFIKNLKLQSVFKYIKEFYNNQFNIYYFLLILLLVFAIIYLNYWHFLERKYANGNSWFRSFVGYYLMYFIPFVTAFLLQFFFYKNINYFSTYWFWIIVCIAPAIFSFRVNFDFHETLIGNKWQGDEQQFWLRSIGWIVRVFVVLIPIYIIWLIKDKAIQPFYGTKALESLKPYLIMLLIMIPLLTWASTQKDFLQTYPKSGFIQYTSYTAQKWRYILFELCYGFDFISIEFFFRGFLILSLLHICGTQCIIPVAVFYCTIHLGKPMAEAISSFWGGLLLGIVSYNTQSIWGGLLVHLGIAWFMEIGGWLGNVFLAKK
jgi:membrane protease YdiL (CAAX protease family)